MTSVHFTVKRTIALLLLSFSDHHFEDSLTEVGWMVVVVVVGGEGGREKSEKWGAHTDSGVAKLYSSSGTKNLDTHLIMLRLQLVFCR